MRVLLILLLGVAAASAAPPRIVGGSTVDISQYPFLAGLMFSRTGSGTFYLQCGGTIINNRNVLTAAHCLHGLNPNQWRARIGSARSSTGGRTINFNRITLHPHFNIFTYDSDIALIYASANIATGGNVQLANIAGPNYNLLDNSVVFSAGWGSINWGGQFSDQLRHVQKWTINQATCRQRYANSGRNVTDNMLCSGYLDIGGRDACTGDNGGPLLHNNIVVGIISWGYECGSPRFPRVTARMSRFTNWVVQNV
ncbi:trypsin, alkaline A-like [Bicyclus anynana]|uniref:Trypsin, alkaline A-like n=1 Tax=Bicyclus anynana TaxID=110368 RepID=A0A6J1MS78_BICAN|nr:trypsin, alkaline A-like [Bicyclus anynana]